MSLLRLPTFLLIGLWVLLASCASTQLVNEWQAPEYQGVGFHKILVIGISEEEGNRRTFEDVLARKLIEHGVEAMPGYRFLPKTDQAADEQTLLAAVRDSGADAVLMTRLVRVKDEIRYTPGYSSGYVDSFGRPGYYGYYRSAWSYYQPPRVDRYQVAVLETNLWDAKSQSLAWSGTTETFDPMDVGREVVEFSNLIVEALAEKGIVGPAKRKI
jgi:hypothetical protein